MWAVVAVFCITYVLIAGRRLSVLPLGRPTGALLGACAMVALSLRDPRFGLTPHEAFAAIEPNTIGLLFGMMLLAAALDEAGFFEEAAKRVAARFASPVALLYAVTIGSGVVSALLVNDSACVMLAPLVDRIARRARLDRVPYLLGLAMGSNAGSAMTLAGNPQNMLVAHLSGMSYREYLVRAGPAGVVALAVTAAVLHAIVRERLAVRAASNGSDEPAVPEPDPVRKNATRVDLAIAILGVAAVSLGFLAGANLAWTAIGGATAVMLLRRRDPSPLFARVSWTVLVFFAALFVVTGALRKTGLPEELLGRFTPPAGGGLGWIVSLTAALVAGCQIVSNVPFILLAEPWIAAMPDPRLAWTVTAIVTTLAGNLTLLGSVANIIVIETAGAGAEIGFRAYLREGVPVTIASTLAALAVLLLRGG